MPARPGRKEERREWTPPKVEDLPLVEDLELRK